MLNHNTESVPRLYRAVRSGARYERTLRLLEYAKIVDPRMTTKSGVMVGLGEEMHELLQVYRDLAAVGTDVLTIGQYLRPSRDHLPMARYYTPEEFAYMREEALAWASATWSQDRWCAPRTMPASRRWPFNFGGIRTWQSR